MDYILVMTLSGSTMFLIVMALERMAGQRISEKVYYMLLKASVIYFLLPLPMLKGLYRKLAESAGIHFGTGLLMDIHSDGKLIIKNHELTYMNDVLKQSVIFFSVWVLLAAVLFTVQIIRHLYCRSKVFRDGNHFSTDEDLQILQKWKEKYRIRRRIVLHPGLEKQGGLTVGLFKPEIIYSGETGLETELVLQHEVIHIKRLDALWRSLSFFALVIHWFNPVAWILFGKMKLVCESSCDEEVLRGRSEEERLEYARMLVVTGKSKNKRAGVAMAERDSNMKKRVMKILERKNVDKGWGLVSIAAVVGLIFLNSLTVLAYEEVQFERWDMDSEWLRENVDKEMGSDVVFWREGEVNPYLLSPIGFDWAVEYQVQFIDNDGNIYPVSTETNVTLSCNHTYESGYISNHTMLTGGGCTLDFYEAQYCTKCGYTIQGAYLNTISYQKCIH